MDSSPPSEMDYAERINSENNKMDIEISNPDMEGLYPSSPSLNTLQTPPQNEEASKSVTAPVTPTAIPYEANSPADPNLWDGHFGSVSLFGTNEFLQNDARNISCSLIRIAQFIRQRNISDRDGNTITQLNSGRQHLISSRPSTKLDGTSSILQTTPPSVIKSKANSEIFRPLKIKTQAKETLWRGSLHPSLNDSLANR